MKHTGASTLTIATATFNHTVTTPWLRVVPEGCMVLNPASGGFIPWDNPDNLISQATEQAVDSAVGAVCLPVLCLISVPCNLLNMTVFWKHGLRERINLCLFYLSFADLCGMINNFLFNVDRLYLQFSEFGPVLQFIVRHHLVGLRSFFTFLSGFVSVLIACDRCYCVLSPLRSQTAVKTRTTGAVLMVGTLLVLTGSMMMGQRWRLICVFHPDTNTTSTAMYVSKFYSDNRAHMDTMTLFVMTLQPFAYVTVVSVMTAVTSVKLKRLVAWREQTSAASLSGRQVALTRTLIAVSVLYVVCSAPAIACGLLVMFVPGMGISGRYYNFSNLLVSVFELATYINASVNFFVYCWLGSRYRDTLRSLFSPCCPRATADLKAGPDHGKDC